MPAIGALLAELEERRMAQRIGIAHDEARMRFPLESNTVEDFGQFREIITRYYNHHYTTCVSRGGGLPASEAYGRAKELLEHEYRRRRGNIVSAFNNAHDGTNGGLRVVLDTIAEGLKAEVVERYIGDAFDRHVAPNSWEQKVEIIRQFVAQCGPYLSSSIKAAQPERYAHDYTELIRSYVNGLQETSGIFRRL
jgi:hypothetical protein